MNASGSPTLDPLRGTICRVVALNLAAFVIEVGVALSIGSVALLADSVDFLEDASINVLILVGFAWSASARAKLGTGLAGVILVPSLATLAMAWHRFGAVTPPTPIVLILTGFGALVVNGTCAWMLARHRNVGGSLTKAAFLSARNDTLANGAIIVAGLVTAATRSAWPDLTVGVAIGLLNAGAAWEVFEAARAERDGRPLHHYDR